MEWVQIRKFRDATWDWKSESDDDQVNKFGF